MFTCFNLEDHVDVDVGFLDDWLIGCCWDVVWTAGNHWMVDGGDDDAND